MAAHIGQPSQSRRYIQLYLGTWGAMAVGALGYLAILAFPHQAATPPRAALEAPAASKVAASEATPVQGEASTVPSQHEVRKEALPTPAGDRIETVRVVVRTRPAASEEPLPGTDAVPPPPQSSQSSLSVAGAEPPAVHPAEQGQETAPAVAPPQTVAAAVNVPAPESTPIQAQAPVSAPTVTAPPPFVPIETGSITPSRPAAPAAKAEIVFGEPVVTRGGQEFAVQLGTSSSLQALKQSWGQLTERHAGALSSLQPRVVAPRGQGGSYRLLAGPFASKAEAEQVCSELQVGAKACFATAYVGAPL